MFELAVIEQVLPPAQTIEEVCLRGASAEYGVDYLLLKAIREKEAGTRGMRKPNSNGTADLGEMQLNTATVPDYAQYGFTERIVQYDTCHNIRIGALHLRTKILETKDIWLGVAWYHSKTPKYGYPYARDIHKRYMRLVEDFKERVHRLNRRLLAKRED